MKKYSDDSHRKAAIRREQAYELTDAIVNKMLYQLRYNHDIYPPTECVNEIFREVKSIIVQRMLRNGSGRIYIQEEPSE